MTAKTAETGWPVCVRLYHPKQDRVSRYRYKSTEGAARGTYFRFDGGIVIDDRWIIAGDRAVYLEGCNARAFFELVLKERTRSDAIMARIKSEV